MEFKESKAIYLQVAERLSNEILQERYLEDERIPSVREYAAKMEVNANTVMRSFEHLQQQGVIYNKRGIGYFVSPGGKEMIYRSHKETFVSEELNEVFRQLDLLDIPIERIVELYEIYCKQKSKRGESI